MPSTPELQLLPPSSSRPINRGSQWPGEPGRAAATAAGPAPSQGFPPAAQPSPPGTAASLPSLTRSLYLFLHPAVCVSDPGL